MDESRAFAFGQFVLAPKRRELRCDGRALGVGSRALDILITLVTRRPEIVSKDELMTAVWPNRIVEDNNLTVHMAALRRALGDGRDGTHFVQTLHGRGYSFVAPVTVVDPDPAAQFAPASLPPRTIQGSRLSRATNPFIGRGFELDEIGRHLKSSRLLTITGIGGIGKTRIALQIGENLSSAYADGVDFVELATVASAGAALDAIAAVFYPGGGEASSLERLVGFVGNREMLLILDNCEHLVEPVAAVTRALLAACPRLTILATICESLSIEGERVYALRPFTVPQRIEAIDAQSALQYDAVRLFVACAAATPGGFTLDDRTAPEIARICARLDGIALAIEMAAPRLQVLSPGQLADRLSERFRLLASQRRDAAPRHRTLRAVFDWSYELLSEPERMLLRRLAVFSGGADFEAIVALAAENLSDEWDLLDLLEALINKSLVISDRSGREPRYRMLETTRQYAIEKWRADEAQRLRGMHATHFAHVFERSEAEWPTTPTSTWLETYAPDADNLRAALDWAFGAGGEAGLGLRLVAHSYPLWWDLPQLPLHESRYWFDLAVSRVTPNTPPEIAARLWFGKSWRDVRFSDTENFPAAAQAATLFRQVGDPIGLGAALWRAGSALLSIETVDEAGGYFDEAEQLLRRGTPNKWLALTLVKQGDVKFRIGELDAALVAYEEAMRLTRATRHWYGLVNGGSNMADLLFHLGQRDRALTQLRDLRAELLPGRSTPLVAKLAAQLLLAGEAAEARETLRETITFAHAIGLRGSLGWAIEALALMLAEAGRIEEAARFAGYARLVHPSAATRSGSRREVFDRLHTLLAERCDSQTLQRWFTQGAAWSDQHAGEVAVAACSN